MTRCQYTPEFKSKVGVCQELCVKKFSRLHHSAS